MGQSNSKLDEILKELGKLGEMQQELGKLGEMQQDMNDMKKTLNRVDLRTAALVESRCREKYNLTKKEVKGVSDALQLIYSEKAWLERTPETKKAVKTLVDKLYKINTRELFRLITGFEWENERQAYTRLNEWLAEKKKGESGNENYAATAEYVVAKKFAKVLEPLATVTAEIGKERHESAMRCIEEDTSGLALSLIMASESTRGDGKAWAWKVLEFDGFGLKHDQLAVLEAKCGSEKATARKQLDLRIRFIDVVATLVGMENKFHVSAYAAILETNDAPEKSTGNPANLKSILSVSTTTESFDL